MGSCTTIFHFKALEQNEENHEIGDIQQEHQGTIFNEVVFMLCSVLILLWFYLKQERVTLKLKQRKEAILLQAITSFR